MARVLAATFAAALLATACGEDKPSAPAQQPAAHKPAPAIDATAPEPVSQIPDEALPVPADFEDAADAEITADNYAKALEELAGEIEADTP